MGKDNVVKWSIINGPKPEKNILDFKNIFDKARKVGERFSDLADIPNDIADYQWNFDADDALEEMIEKINIKMVEGLKNI